MLQPIILDDMYSLACSEEIKIYIENEQNRSALHTTLLSQREQGGRAYTHERGVTQHS